jgi:uncharacterized membrane protein
MNTREKENNSKVWDHKDSWIVAVSLVLFGIASIFYPQLPDQVVSKFNMVGDPIRTMSKWSFWLLYGGIALILPVTTKFTRNLDPRKSNYLKFESTFETFRWATVVFIHFIFGAGVAYNLGYPVSMNFVLLFALGMLWLIMGNRMGKIRFNYFIGIRTPWTLTNEDVWRKTHRVAGRCWFIAGILFLVALFLPAALFIPILILNLILSTLVPMIYSYLMYRKTGQSS